MPRCPIDAVPELKDIFSRRQASGYFVPISLLNMQCKPKLVKAFRQLSAAVFGPDAEVGPGFKRPLAVTSTGRMELLPDVPAVRESVLSIPQRNK